MQIFLFSYYSIFILSSFLIIFSSQKKANKSKEQHNSNKTLHYDDISSIYKWAQKNGIYINKKLNLNKNSQNDINHTFYYFTANETIKNNTLLLSIPSSIFISPNSVDKMYKKGKNKKLANLWDKVLNINQYLNYSSSKQLFYLSVMLSHATFNQKGKLYKKYEEYLNMYNYINLDDYPIFFKKREMKYLNYSSFGKEIKNNLDSINNEYYLIKHELEMDSTIIVEEFIKYRILSLANSFYYNNRTYIIPLIDCFQKKVNYSMKDYSSHIVLKRNNNSDEFKLDIYSTKKIRKNEEISILWKQLSNTENYLYYGFVDENNMIIPRFLVEFLNKNFLKDLNIDAINKKYNINYENFIKPKSFDLNTDFYDHYLSPIYENLSYYIEKYYRDNEGPYLMMKDNLKYYLDLYNDLYNDDLINRNIDGINKKKCVKNILGMEKKLLESRIKIIEDRIKYIVNNKEERDIYLLLKRAKKINSRQK